METLNISATENYLKLTEGKIVHNLSVQDVGEIKGFSCHSVTHRTSRQTSVPAGLEMVFINVAGDIFPMSYSQPDLDFHEEGLKKVDGQLVINESKYREQLAIANSWIGSLAL